MEGLDVLALSLEERARADDALPLERLGEGRFSS
jgi:hypothetical protein